MTFSERILQANEQFNADQWKLPEGIRALNPFEGEQAHLVREINRSFYQKFYNDSDPRKLILGINPGRLGAGATGVPFTDTKNMEEYCGISSGILKSHEPSSVFMYRMIEAYGGANDFYKDVFIHSVCPLGFVKRKPNGNEVNYNYYDDKELETSVLPYITEWLKELSTWRLDLNRVFCLGSGKNLKFLNSWNREHKIFGEIVSLDHPRYVIQYKAKSMDAYIEKYLIKLKSEGNGEKGQK